MKDTAIRLMIIDDNQEHCNTLRHYFDQLPDMSVVAIASNGADGYDLYRKCRPDVVLLDLVMPCVDGFGFLEMAARDHLLEHHRVIIMSETSQENIIRYAFHLGAHYFALKPLDHELLANRIRYIANDVAPMKYYENANDSAWLLDVQSKVAKELIESGLPVHTLGYKYFESALIHLLCENCDIFSVTKSVYPYIASKFYTSSSSVDKAMRHSLSLAYTQNTRSLKRYLEEMNYRDISTRPSNSEYLSLMLASIKQNVLTPAWS